MKDITQIVTEELAEIIKSHEPDKTAQLALEEAQAVMMYYKLIKQAEFSVVSEDL